DEPERGELADDRLPRLGFDVPSLPEHLLLLVPEAEGLLRLLAHQHVDDMPRAEALAGAVDGGKRLDRGVRAVPGLDRVAAGVAVAAAARMGLAEMLEDRLAATVGCLADGEQRGELAVLDALDFVGRVALVDHPPAQRGVA